MPSADSPAHDFVPLARLRRKAADPPRFDAGVVRALDAELERFAAQLSPEERAVLASMVGLGGRSSALAALGALPAAAVLAPEEAEILARVEAAPAPQGRGLRSPLAVIMKGTKRCNLRCTYCRSWSDEPNQVMPFEVLARSVRGTLMAPEIDHAEFIWHGGETTLRPISFYRKALWLEQRFRRPGQRVSNSIQTNGTTLDEAWLDFLAQFGFSVGVSLDGPPEVHDRRRLDVRGRPTSHLVRRGLEMLQARDIPHGVLMVVDDEVVEAGAERMLSYFLELEVRKVSLLNVGPEGEPDRALPGDYLTFARFVGFLDDLFRLWWPAHRQRIDFREISDLVRKLERGQGSFCVFGDNCMGGVLTIEPMGEISICDKYQGDDDYRLGNVLAGEVADLSSVPAMRRAHQATAAEMELARGCPWFEICRGGCPHDRYIRAHRSPSGDESCCGWAPLIATIAEAVGRARSLQPTLEARSASRSGH